LTHILDALRDSRTTKVCAATTCGDASGPDIAKAAHAFIRQPQTVILSSSSDPASRRQDEGAKPSMSATIARNFCGEWMPASTVPVRVE
jgi:hypothetical protein